MMAYQLEASETQPINNGQLVSSILTEAGFRLRTTVSVCFLLLLKCSLPLNKIRGAYL